MQDNHQRDDSLPLTVTLRNGRGVIVRPICAEDKGELGSAFERLGPEARYTRFFTSVRALPEKVLDSATHPSPDREVALIALSDDGSRQIIIGGARYVAAPGSDVCEFAVTVADDWHGVGLARCLMETLIEIARARGFLRMEGFVLHSNSSMRGLAARLGFADVQCPEDRSVRVVTLEL
ncbi:N-acetyltransferase GCN5 [Caballeronia terrestris]|uniref:N-acetyltransferase GCN5 n=1 Tax=Caballeronia terrestris TaxID=1226301 RepID=A0A158KS75_9BURK|nr:GNAT family N-acetyltransferase [Caballeronia terrestris]SAL83291.1 N-acetyltransferase GCN5 [Caballeronia terrestris]